MIRYKLTEGITLEITDVGRDMDLALMHATGFGVDAWPAWLREKDNPVWWVKDRGLHNVEGVNIPPISTDDDAAEKFMLYLHKDHLHEVRDQTNADNSSTFTIIAHNGYTVTATHVTFAGAVAWAALAFFAEGLADAPEPTVSSEWATEPHTIDGVPVFSWHDVADRFEELLQPEPYKRLEWPEEQAKFLASSADEVRDTLRQISELRNQGGRVKDATPRHEREGDEVHVSYSSDIDAMAQTVEAYKRLQREGYKPELKTLPADLNLPAFGRLGYQAAIASELRKISEAFDMIERTRATILAALTAEIGDAATAERLTGVVMRALEGNGDE